MDSPYEQLARERKAGAIVAKLLAHCPEIGPERPDQHKPSDATWDLVVAKLREAQKVAR